MSLLLVAYLLLFALLLYVLYDINKQRVEAEQEVDHMLDEILQLNVRLANSVPFHEYERWRNRAMALMEQFAPAHYAMARARDAQLARVEDETS
jgi:hypothetical protein